MTATHELVVPRSIPITSPASVAKPLPRREVLAACAVRSEFVPLSLLAPLRIPMSAPRRRLICSAMVRRYVMYVLLAAIVFSREIGRSNDIGCTNTNFQPACSEPSETSTTGSRKEDERRKEEKHSRRSTIQKMSGGGCFPSTRKNSPSLASLYADVACSLDMSHQKVIQKQPAGAAEFLSPSLRLCAVWDCNQAQRCERAQEEEELQPEREEAKGSSKVTARNQKWHPLWNAKPLGEQPWRLQLPSRPPRRRM